MKYYLYRRPPLGPITNQLNPRDTLIYFHILPSAFQSRSLDRRFAFGNQNWRGRAFHLQACWKGAYLTVGLWRSVVTGIWRRGKTAQSQTCICRDSNLLGSQELQPTSYPPTCINSFTKVERETVDVWTSDVAFGTRLKVANGRHWLALPNFRSCVLLAILVWKRPRMRREDNIKIDQASKTNTVWSYEWDMRIRPDFVLMSSRCWWRWWSWCDGDYDNYDDVVMKLPWDQGHFLDTHIAFCTRHSMVGVLTTLITGFQYQSS